MPFYDVPTYAATTNASAGTETTQMWAHTATSEETVSVTGLYAASRFGTAGGCQLRAKTNTGTTASGGTGSTPTPRNARLPAAGSTWANGATAITPGATLVVRMSIGFAATGGMGGWIPIVPAAGIQLMPASTNPVDFELTSLASQASVTHDISVEFQEGVA
jgi:hypothetical protein